jgi:hypothetical protein
VGRWQVRVADDGKQKVAGSEIWRQTNEVALFAKLLCESIVKGLSNLASVFFGFWCLFRSIQPLNDEAIGNCQGFALFEGSPEEKAEPTVVPPR